MAENKNIIIRSSAAEYLTFIAASGNDDVNALYADENIWLSQKMMGLLYDVETNTINYHLKQLFADTELDENSVIQDFRITANDGKAYNTKQEIIDKYRRKPIFKMIDIYITAVNYKKDLTIASGKSIYNAYTRYSSGVFCVILCGFSFFWATKAEDIYE